MNEFEMAASEYDLFDNVPLGVCLLRQDFNVLFWNSQLEHWTGVPRGVIVGTDLTARFTHLKNSKYTDRINIIFEGGPPTVFSSLLHKYVIPAPLPDGKLRVQHTTAIATPSPDGEQHYALLAIQDVTDLTYRIQDCKAMRDRAVGEIQRRKLAEAEIIRSNNRLNAIINSATGFYISTADLAGKVTSWNKGAELMMGYTEDEIVGKMNITQMLPGDSSRSEVLESATKVILERGSFDGEVALRRKNGDVFPGLLSISQLKDETGVMIGTLAIVQDITERKRTEEQVKNYSQNLEEMVEQRTAELEKTLHDLQNTQSQLLQSEKMASIGQLAAGVAHEINNPVGYINSNLNIMAGFDSDTRTLIGQYRALMSGLREAMITEEGRASVSEKLDRIEKLEKEIEIDFVLDDSPNLIKECQEGSERIQKIVLDLKDFAHPGEEGLKYVDLNHNLDSTLNIVWNEIKYKASVTKEYEDLPEVSCHPQQLNQVFMNLMVNAAQAIEEKGEIRIVTRAVDSFVEIEISDTGVGIPKENIRRIFDPFFTTKEVGKGTGLGLNVAYNIVRKHSGLIDVESTVGNGTTFTVRLPVDGNAGGQAIQQ
ncbi:MAG: PAS domain S-box protein [Thermodesulfobacteriota bacterium]|nr:PAS domain S-box protein [Thermodesulfobacteriota bacterium]